MSDNFFSDAYNWYAKHGPRPLTTAALLGLGTYGLGRLAWGPIVETLRSLGRKPAHKLLGGTQAENNRDWDEAMDNLKSESQYRRWIPAAIAALATGGALWAFHAPDEPYKGLLNWVEPSYAKTASLDAPFNHVQDMGMNSYVTDLDWNRRIDTSVTAGLFKDPHLDDSPYARQMGTAIVANAALQQHTRKPTLGGIFDSAVEKIENKLTFGGLTNVALKTAVANGVSRLFASSLDAVCGLPPQARQTLVDAGTWAGAVKAMLE